MSIPSLSSTLLCQWANVSFAGRWFDMCVFPPSVDSFVSRQLLNSHSWERPLVESALKTLGASRSKKPVLLDLGANIGTWSLAAATAGHQVVAVEPVPRHVEMLRQSLRVNRLANRVTVLLTAVGSRGMRSIGSHSFNQGATKHQLTTTMKAGTLVQSAQVDDVVTLSSSHVFIKMDVEESECEVVSGMNKLLSTNTVIGATIEMHLSTQRCCRENAWWDAGGVFHTLTTRHHLCPKHMAIYHASCNNTRAYDLEFIRCG